MSDRDKLLNELEQTASRQNDGRGVRCIKAIITYARRGEWKHASSIRSLEGDKTRNYPEVEKVLFKLFGCRMHSDTNCQDYWCKRFNDA